jgi:hypothetical protein
MIQAMQITLRERCAPPRQPIPQISPWSWNVIEAIA